MSDFSSMGKGLVLLGLILVVVGGIIVLTGKVPFLGKLPGDIRIEKSNFSFYFPVVTCLLLSALLSLIFWIVSWFK
ncbi:MAG TPA: DUF2905 domain-containing protein [bacterium]